MTGECLGEDECGREGRDPETWKIKVSFQPPGYFLSFIIELTDKREVLTIPYQFEKLSIKLSKKIAHKSRTRADSRVE